MSLREKLDECSVLLKPVMTKIPSLAVSLGKDGVLCCQSPPSTHTPDQDKEKTQSLHYLAAAKDKLPLSVLSASGAGDR